MTHRPALARRANTSRLRRLCGDTTAANAGPTSRRCLRRTPARIPRPCPALRFGHRSRSVSTRMATLPSTGRARATTHPATRMPLGLLSRTTTRGPRRHHARRARHPRQCPGLRVSHRRTRSVPRPAAPTGGPRRTRHPHVFELGRRTESDRRSARGPRPDTPPASRSAFAARRVGIADRPRATASLYDRSRTNSRDSATGVVVREGAENHPAVRPGNARRCERPRRSNVVGPSACRNRQRTATTAQESHPSPRHPSRAARQDSPAAVYPT